ncbi:MAG TPA: DNA repair protein RecN [Vicinamibacterales bacterium]|nr:DNA repair protein RecN [Vicinamibacterales bacterium]
MIRYLAIRNLAVIEAVSVEFEQSFNILTGETGAGKSILVEAVGLLLGGRASQDLVRTGEDLATVEAIFEDAGTEIVVRREITAQGRSRAFISGGLATAAALKELSSRLVELHGQHEHQQLLDPEQHLPLLDTWAGLQSERQEIAEAYQAVQRLRQQLDRLRMDSRERAARLELIEFQLKELTAAALTPDEDESLGTLRHVLRSAETIQRLCAESYGELYDDEDSVLTRLGRVWKRVGELGTMDPRFGPYLDQRESVKAQLEDLALTLRDYAASIDASPGRLEQVEERLALMERMKRKHGPTLQDALAKREALAAEHAALTGGSSSATAVEDELARASATFLDLARSLSRARRSAATRFARALEGELADLAMEQTRFEVRLTSAEEETHWSPRGIDAGEFYLSPNLGEDLRPLARIVSGGELSRVMLALKTLAAAEQPGRTLIFDEVDAGIGGRVATVVGEKLRTLGERFQVLCITHLPQIAAAGATHFSIEKTVRGSRTVTSVERLSPDARVEEIARMIGGANAGDQARASARELISSAGRTSTKVADARASGGGDTKGTKRTKDMTGRRSKL